MVGDSNAFALLVVTEPPSTPDDKSEKSEKRERGKVQTSEFSQVSRQK